VKSKIIVVMLAAAVLSCLAAEVALAEGTSAFQLALFNPIQLRDESMSIFALRLSLIYGRNVSVQGLDVGLVNVSTGGSSVGLQWGLVGYNEGNFVGWQHNLVGVTKGHFGGFQSGCVNVMTEGEALQYGLVNVAQNVGGLQIGLVNFTQRMHGLQIGIINVIRQKEKMPVLPIINWMF
jgi:hypothetical protein